MIASTFTHNKAHKMDNTELPNSIKLEEKSKISINMTYKSATLNLEYSDPKDLEKLIELIEGEIDEN
jgi:hypothetical protein